MAPQRLFANTNPVMQLGAYNEPLLFEAQGVGTNKGQQIPQPFMQSLSPTDLEAIKETLKMLYGPCLRQIDRPYFYKPYPKAINRENPYQRGYRIPKFSLFSGEDGEFTLKHVVVHSVVWGSGQL